MAAFDTPRAAYLAVSHVSRLGESIAALLGELAAWNDARVTRRTLNKLSDRELADIGLCRGDIEAVARTGRR